MKFFEDSGIRAGDYIYRHHVSSRNQLLLHQTESFPIPLTYIDVLRQTETDLGRA